MKILYNLKSIFFALFAIVMLSACSTDDNSQQVGTLTDMSIMGAISGSDAENVKFKVEPSLGVENYMVGVVSQNEFEGMESNPEALADYIVENYGALVDFAFPDFCYIFTGYNSVDIADVWDLEPASSYVAAAFAVSSKGEVAGDVCCQTFTTNTIYDYSNIKGDVLLNEIYTVGNEDWVEFYNTTNSTINLAGFSLTAQGIGEELSTYEFPVGAKIEAGSYFVIDQNVDFDFGISKGGEYITLLDKAGDIVDELDFQGVSKDCSYGRTHDGADMWTTFANPTKELDNTTKIIVEPKPYYGELNLFVTKATTSNIVVKVERNDYKGTYMAFPCPLDQYNVYYDGDPYKLAMSISYSLLGEYTLADLTRAGVTYSRDATISNFSQLWTAFEDAKPGDEFVIIAFGLDEYGDTLTEVSYVTASLALE